MIRSRRDVLAQLAALAATAALPGSTSRFTDRDPLDGTVADYVAGLRKGLWSAAEITTRALDRCRTVGMSWRAIDVLSPAAMRDARAADARRRGGRPRGPLDVLAKNVEEYVRTARG